MKIRIISTPPGSVAPEEIRKQWVGVEIPVAEGGEPEGALWVGQQNVGGYVVSITDAIDALRTAGKERAAQFWEEIQASIGDKLRFKKECCEIV
ncbi:MAG: hypothetical protein KBC78_04060 [Candidatus Pacebacteria bacterium]|nr:hypothetical protein [Candidatus Paceibacterota bacterium]